MSMIAPQREPLSTGGPGVSEVTFRAFSETDSGTTTKSYGTLALGPAAPNRGIVVIVASQAGSGGATASAVTVGGVSLSSVDFGVGGSGSTPRISMWAGTVPAGTTGEVVVTFDVQPDGQNAVYVYSVNGNGTFAETDSDNDGHSSGTGHSGTVNLAEQGCVIAGCFAYTSSGSATITFTGVTEDDENDIGGNDPFACGSYGPAAADAAYAVSADQGASDKGCFVIGSFQMT